MSLSSGGMKRQYSSGHKEMVKPMDPLRSNRNFVTSGKSRDDIVVHSSLHFRPTSRKRRRVWINKNGLHLSSSQVSPNTGVRISSGILKIPGSDGCSRRAASTFLTTSFNFDVILFAGRSSNESSCFRARKLSAISSETEHSPLPVSCPSLEKKGIRFICKGRCKLTRKILTCRTGPRRFPLAFGRSPHPF